MQKIWEFFENLNEFVYVSDMETNELVYVNKKMLETYGFHSVEELKGKKCYEVIQNCAVPCAMCNNKELKPGEFIEWRYYNPIIDKHVIVKDTLLAEEGKKYRMEIAIDVNSWELQGSKAANYENMETILNEGLRVALRAPDPDHSLHIILEYFGKALGSERTYIFERNKNGCDDNTYEWTANGVKPEIDNLQNLPPEVCANWYSNFRENKNIMIEDLEDIKDSDPLQYANLKRQNIHTLVVVPLYKDRKVIGFYGVDNPPKELLEYTTNMLQIMGHFIVATLAQRNLVRQLQKMSYFDQLTEMGNRYAMKEYVEQLGQDESIGVIYCDITGLKQVNDSHGHKAGDQLIVNCSNCLKQTFEGYGLFRIGGDEMLVLCAGISEELLQEKVKQLKTLMQEQRLSMAVGMVWKPRLAAGLDLPLTEAESRMYADKAAYYKSAGMDRRKKST